MHDDINNKLKKKINVQLFTEGKHAGIQQI